VESDGEPFTAMGLGPMAVDPEHQGRGVGSMLVREGLRRCREMGQPVVVVLGHPWFYPQFGFVPASGKGIRSEYDVPDEAFMIAELEPEALNGRAGLVRYLPEFAGV
jgi:putative acetyltransferase